MRIIYLNLEQEEKSCSSNSKKATELHVCPFREEINGDCETLCDCDEEQTYQCAMDI